MFTPSGFGRKILELRIQFGLTPDAAADASGISMERLAALERGACEPTGDEVLILADNYRRDFRYLLDDAEPDPAERTTVLFREHGGDLLPDDRLAIAEFSYLCGAEAALEQMLGRRPDRPGFAFRAVGTFFKGQGRDCASALRGHLGLREDQVVRDVYATMRSMGFRVFRRRLANSGISGLFMDHPDAGPCILVNLAEGQARQRFSAAHEWGHALLDGRGAGLSRTAEWEGNDRIELRASTFASCLLMPPALLRSGDAQRWADPAEVASWATRLRVSAPALLSALFGSGLLTQDQRVAMRHRIPRVQDAVDPELENLNPVQAARKVLLLARGLSGSYVGLALDASPRAGSAAGSSATCSWRRPLNWLRSPGCLGGRWPMDEDLPPFTVDVRTFHPSNSLDTCAAWNLLSSARLTAAARSRGCGFAVAGYVRFEALDKPRTDPTAEEVLMREELRGHLARGIDFREVGLSADDLVAVARLPSSRSLGRGELAAAALALRIRCAVMTDDQQARRLLAACGLAGVQTTPHLLGWLSYQGELTDGDVQTVVAEHERRIPHRRGRLSRFFVAAWRQAMQHLLARDRRQAPTQEDQP